jgi:4,5-DOPA dioxygenase extradiol
VTTVEKIPAAFLGHGSPMNALSDNTYTAAWRALGESLPRPRAIVVVSAHWYINATAVTAMTSPRTIHDFYGFPEELFAIKYPAPGDLAVAEEIAEVAKPLWVGSDHDSWGIDHGAWSVLVHAFPRADIPVVQLSINAEKPFEYHFELGAKLGPLRERGILVISSGNVVHNLKSVDPSQPNSGFDWAHRFDDAARDIVTSRPSDIISLRYHTDFRQAVPTPDHFIPLLYLAGLAAAEESSPQILVDGYSYGSLSMTSYTLDGAFPDSDPTTTTAAALPDPSTIPADQTNT